MTCIGNISERVNEEPQSSRGRSKYSTYGSNFKAGRKSSSLMNLCGKRSLINTRYGLTHVVGIRATVAWCVGFLSVAAGGAASALSTAPLSTVHCPLPTVHCSAYHCRPTRYGTIAMHFTFLILIFELI